MRYCTNCGREVNDAANNCPYCGVALPQREAAPAAPAAAPAASYQQPTYAPQPTYAQPQVNVMTNAPITEANLPAEYRPLSPWAYFGLTLLFSVPIVGFVFLIIFSFKKTNINRRNFARSIWIPLFIGLAVFLVLLLVGVIGGAGGDISSAFKRLF